MAPLHLTGGRGRIGGRLWRLGLVLFLLPQVAHGLGAAAAWPTASSASEGWSLTYPPGWRLQQSAGAALTIVTPDGDGACGVHAWSRSLYASLDDFTYAALALVAANLLSKENLVSRLLWQRPVTLASGEPAREVLVDLLPGGRSHRLLSVSARGQAFALDCEAELEDWPRYGPQFERMIRSFRILP
jgi:hypothetical protein